VGLRECLRKKTLSVSPGDLAVMFSNIEILLDIHQKMLSELENMNTKWPALDSIGATFIDMARSYFSIVKCAEPIL
jgi:hypothetical protein